MAARKSPRNTARKTTAAARRATVLDAGPRHLWLASLGLLVAARREGLAVAGRAAGRVESVVADARGAIRRAEADLRSGLGDVRAQVQPKARQFGNEVEAGLAPIMARLGLKKKAKRAARKPASRRAPHKPARRVARKAAAR